MNFSCSRLDGKLRRDSASSLSLTEVLTVDELFVPFCEFLYKFFGPLELLQVIVGVVVVVVFPKVLQSTSWHKHSSMVSSLAGIALLVDRFVLDLRLRPRLPLYAKSKLKVCIKDKTNVVNSLHVRLYTLYVSLNRVIVFTPYNSCWLGVHTSIYIIKSFSWKFYFKFTRWRRLLVIKFPRPKKIVRYFYFTLFFFLLLLFRFWHVPQVRDVT